MQSGLLKIQADRRDYSLLHTFGAVAPNPATLPDTFSIYDGREIPNQNDIDTRFNPFLPPMPFGCTGEAGAFESGLQDNALYNPKELYDRTSPGGTGGRQIRDMLKALTLQGPVDATGTRGPRRTAFFNCYGSGAISDFEAAMIALWINQGEKRGVYIGSWFYNEFEFVGSDGVTSVPSFKTADGTLHCYLMTGWKPINGVRHAECLTWQGPKIGFRGVIYIPMAVYNALMRQPYTGAFTITKTLGTEPQPLGWQVWVDHLVYFIQNLFNISPMTTPEPIAAPEPVQPTQTTPVPERPTERLAEAAIGMLGKDASPKNLAPQELSCAEGVSNIINSVYTDFPAELLGTVDLYHVLRSSPHFTLVSTPVRGCVVVSPTTGDNHGHTGIYTQENVIASNDSRTGLFGENYTRQSWIAYFGTKKGLSGYLFMPV